MPVKTRASLGRALTWAEVDENFSYLNGKWVSVKDTAYGAKGDGVTDDYAAIQACLNAAPTGSIVIMPAGTYRVSAGITIPAGVRLVALGYARAASNGGVIVIGDLAVTPIITLDGGAGSYATALTGVFVTRAVGAVPASSIGVLVQNSNASLLEDVNVYRSAIAYKYASTAVNSKMERCETGTISSTHLWLEGFGLMAHSCRLGKDGGADVNCNEYVRIKGGGDTYFFNECHFNQSAGVVTRLLYFDTYSSPNGIISFEQCHAELCSTGIASTGTTAVSRLGFYGCTVDVGGNALLSGIPSGMLSNFTLIGNYIHGALTHTGHTLSRIVGNEISDAIVLDACSGVFAANNLGTTSFTIQGACTGLKAGGNNFLSNAVTISYTATGDWSATGNTKAGRAEWDNSFVPVVSPNAGAFGAGAVGSMSYTIGAGNRLHYYVKISIPNNGTGSGNVRYTLPFTPVGNVSVASGIESALTGKAIQAVWSAASSTMLIVDYTGAYPGTSGMVLELNGHLEISP